jgi:FixJ family two-component response regulator
VPDLVEQLTAHALEILRLVATGTPNQAIAEQLVVTLDTIKNTSPTSSARSARPTAPRPSPAPGSSA